MTNPHLATTLGTCGSTLCRTPHLNALARDGLVCENACAAYSAHADLLHRLRPKLDAWLVASGDCLVERFRRLRDFV